LTTTRRQFLSAALLALTPKSERPITGSFVNEDFPQGHLLRDRAAFPKPVETLKIPLVIVGAGVAGLSAAWRLDKRGFRDFVVLELAQQAGGNARWGENEITAYPWGAHYVPVPDKSAVLVRELFEELGVLRDGQWEERDLCFSPKERLFLHGRWQEDIEPAIGLTDKDRDQFRRFADRIDHFRRSGEFTIPMALGAQPSPLDRVSVTDWMREQGFDSTYLNWYINYACRDDYGALASDTSAWAGIHYFASRQPEEKGPITWPEGNGWIIKKLLSKLGRFVHTGAMVNHISQVGRGLRIRAGENEYLAEVVIFSAPTFLAPYLIEGFPPVHDFVYSPWLTANITLEHLPRETGLELAWDNVNYDSPTLGYVVATHQTLRTFVDRSVWTFYWSLAQGNPSENRRLLLEKDWSYWKEAILNDLARTHPDIRSCVSRIDIMRMGHAMARPTVGAIFAEERRRLANPSGRLLFANSDLSGFSIFEEAQYHGVKAAEYALRMLGSH
jgi:glycine/D-amino acid oxidase-like deaminating enzyme